MKTILIILITTISAYAGIGGIAGGNNKFQRGDKILFQRHSTFVNAHFSRSLCHDGFDYEAMISKCVRWEKDDDNRVCVEKEIVKAYQPMDSTRQRCKKYEDGNCKEWEEILFFQSPNRIVEIKDEDGNVKKRKKVTIPSCKE